MTDIDRRENILPTILDAVGGTPMVRLNKVPQMLGLKCEVVAKCEFMNPGGSIKDRIGVRMVRDAHNSGRLKPGDKLAEPTSGNTGVGISMAAAVLGYKPIIAMPQKMSKEKESVLRALNAEVIRTPTEASWDSPESHISLCNRMASEDPTVHVLDQYKNEGNLLAHYEGTAEEIYRQCQGKVDMVVMGVGTGGTITGVAKKLKEKIPGVKIVGVDPIGSLLAHPKEGVKDFGVNQLVEGIGYDFVPQVFDHGCVDLWIKSNDKDSFELARMVQRHEGMLCGGSSGSAMMGVREFAKDLREDQRCVVVFPDNIRNYLTKFIDDDWMKEVGMMEGEPSKPSYDKVIHERDALQKQVEELQKKIDEQKK